MADSLTSLVMWRALQGMGGGLLIPLGQALTWQQFSLTSGRNFPPR
jgi:MFS family permease